MPNSSAKARADKRNDDASTRALIVAKNKKYALDNLDVAIKGAVADRALGEAINGAIHQQNDNADEMMEYVHHRTRTSLAYGAVEDKVSQTPSILKLTADEQSSFRIASRILDNHVGKGTTKYMQREQALTSNREMDAASSAQNIDKNDKYYDVLAGALNESRVGQERVRYLKKASGRRLGASTTKPFDRTSARSFDEAMSDLHNKDLPGLIENFDKIDPNHPLNGTKRAAMRAIENAESENPGLELLRGLSAVAKNRMKLLEKVEYQSMRNAAFATETQDRNSRNKAQSVSIGNRTVGGPAERTTISGQDVLAQNLNLQFATEREIGVVERGNDRERDQGRESGRGL